MNLFISWSGERSEAVAKPLHPWIKCVIQNINPFFSPSDITGGSIWINKLNDKLASSNAGIICLTPENQHKPWIQFEAGALAKGLTENRVFVLLIGMESHEVSGPLSSFNHTPATREGIEKMVNNLNELLGEQSLNQEILNKVFALNFPELLESIEAAEKITSTGQKPETRDSSEMQIEILELLRGLTKRVSNVEQSIIQNKGIIYTNKFTPPPIPIFEDTLTEELIKNISTDAKYRNAIKRAITRENSNGSDDSEGGI